MRKNGSQAVSKKSNYNIIAKMALSIIEKEKESKYSKPMKRRMAALDDEFRSKLIAVKS